MAILMRGARISSWPRPAISHRRRSEQSKLTRRSTRAARVVVLGDGSVPLRSQLRSGRAYLVRDLGLAVPGLAPVEVPTCRKDTFAS